MTSILQMLFQPLPNAIMTALLGITALYWLLTFISGDFLGDLDVDVETDIGMDVDVDGAIASEPSILQKALGFINVGKVPIMLVVSVFKFIAWIFTIATSMIWNLGQWGWKSALILIPIFIISYFLTKVATKPFIKIYHHMGYNGEASHDLIGRIALLKSNIQGDALGAAELNIQNDVIKILVKSKTGAPLKYHAQITLVAESDDKQFYWVLPEINIHNVLQ